MALCFTASFGLLAQSGDERVLFTVEDNPVTVDEFVYIYSKTNGEQADFSEQSLQEYLDLYVKFKLKVQRARDMQLDTISALQEELNGYRRQLADSYLIDRAIGDELLQEAYAHMQQDVDISHILISARAGMSPSDTLAAYQRAQAALDRIQQGESFEAVAAEASDDRYSKERGGRVGYITALFPQGLHRLEKAAYKTPLNKVVGPIRTDAGYHVLKVHDRRPARGEMEVAHILIRKEGKADGEARAMIGDIYGQLQSGTSFDELARTRSEDRRTAENNGYLGFFGINRYERTFEDAAFALTEDDTYTEPIETGAGWHIIKRISRKTIQPFAAEKPRLEGMIRQDGRFDEAKLNLLQRIRRQSNFNESTDLLEDFLSSLPDTFTTFRWKAPEPSNETLFSLDGGYTTTLGDFTTYLGKGTRRRVMLAREGDAQTAARIMYDEFINDQLLKYEESRLEDRYPEFRSLMREYEEGILLFEATKMEVWDRAAQDTTGLKSFAQTIIGKYRWDERARATVYQIGLTHQADAEAIRNYALTHGPDEVKAQFNSMDTTKVSAEEVIYEKGRNAELSTIEWKAGNATELNENRRSRSIRFVKIEEILPPADKSLSEARGYIIADYQDQLEREWVDGLREQYDVDIKRNVFKSLIRS